MAEKRLFHVLLQSSQIDQTIRTVIDCFSSHANFFSHNMDFLNISYTLLAMGKAFLLAACIRLHY